ncbi:MAG TPA: hypothetical protein VH415_14115 [Nitrososphaeraceae archaeon]|jgi:hypothetical protein
MAPIQIMLGGGTRVVYIIPYSKKAVHNIIAKSAHAEQYAIRYVVKFTPEGSITSVEMTRGMGTRTGGGIRNQFPYKMLV